MSPCERRSNIQISLFVGRTSSAHHFRMGRAVILTLVTLFLRMALATTFRTQNADYDSLEELTNVIKSALEGFSLALDAESRIARMETKIQAVETNLQQFQEDIKDLKTNTQESLQAGKLLKTQFDTTITLLGGFSNTVQCSDDCEQKIEAASGKLLKKLENMEASLNELKINVTNTKDSSAANSVAIADLKNVASRVSVLESNTQALKQSINSLKPQVEVVTPKQEKPKCPKPFKLVKEDCLHLVLKKMSWENARTNCKDLASTHSLKGDLAVPSDMPAFLEFMKKEATGTPWPWIGAFAEDDKATKWKWVTNATFDQSSVPWDSSEPSKSSTEKAMCLKQSNLKFHNCRNSLSLHSVCEIFL